MTKPCVIIADTDERYLSSLEYKFISELGDDVDIEIISDINYFNEYFSTPKTVEILAVSENLYSRELLKHNIAHLVVLSESQGSGATEELGVAKVYKYTNVKEIFNELTYKSREILFAAEKKDKETKIISVYSAAGGTGKTTVGLGLAMDLANNHQRVLYINTESIQDFGYYVEEHSPMSMDGVRSIREDLNQVYQNIKPFIRKEAFDYVPQFSTTLDALNINFTMYKNLIMNSKKSGDYDFIVVDIESGYDKNRIDLFEMSDKILFIINQDESAVRKTEFLVNNISIHEKDRYMMICNKYEKEKKNAYLDSNLMTSFPLNKFVEKNQKPLSKAREMGELNGIKGMSYLFI